MPRLPVLLAALAVAGCASVPSEELAAVLGPSAALPPPAAPGPAPPSPAAPADAGCDPAEDSATVELPEGETPAYVTDVACLEQLAHRAANVARAEAGLAPLEWDPALAAMARAHSEDMVRRGYLAHVSPDGDGLPQRLEAAGVDCSAGSAENVAYTSPVLLNRFQTRDGQEVRTVVWGDRALAGGEPVATWLGSPPHRRNLLHPGHTRHAVGFAYDADAQEYRVTQVLCA